MHVTRYSAGERSDGEQSSSTLLSAQALFEGLLDYAGLYPPATLAANDALAHYVAYRSQPYGWLLSRFVLGASHLSEIGELSQYGFSKDAPLAIALVSREAMADIARLIASPLLRDGCGVLSSVEVVVDPSRSIREQCREVQQLLTALQRFLSLSESPALFFEVPYGEAWDVSFSALLEVLQELRREPSHGEEKSIIGFKLRCGGASPSATPPPSLVSLVLSCCANLGVPVKFTAGLHQPFRHQVPAVDGGLEQVAHGYFNLLFAALVAAHDREEGNRGERSSRSVTAEELSSLISEVRSQHPQFTEQGLEWQGHFLSTETISRLRATQVISFGTCSFVEPLEEALKRGWL
jgi:hypothetical protein